MKTLVCLLIVSTFVLVDAQETPDGETPAQETFCSEHYESLGGNLFGVCTSYCEAMDCNSATPNVVEEACDTVGHLLANTAADLFMLDPEDIDPNDVCRDTDGDGHPNFLDNCVNTPNLDQANSDTDSHGNGCDNCPDVDNEDQADSNGNGVGDACEEVCGDGIVNDAPNEQCDDGNTINGDGCSSTCQIEAPETCQECFDGCVDPHTQCLANCGGADAACFTLCAAVRAICEALCVNTTDCVCGDGIVIPPEQCDDGNTVNGDGCSSTCTTEGNTDDPCIGAGGTAGVLSPCGICCSGNTGVDCMATMDCVGSCGGNGTNALGTIDPSDILDMIVANTTTICEVCSDPATDDLPLNETSVACYQSCTGLITAEYQNDNRVTTRGFVTTEIALINSLSNIYCSALCLIEHVEDCNGDCLTVLGGREGAIIDDCGICAGGYTGVVPCDTQTCGNGITEAPEECDDGNTINGDGCSSTCQTEATICPCAGLYAQAVDMWTNQLNHTIDTCTPVSLGSIDWTGQEQLDPPDSEFSPDKIQFAVHQPDPGTDSCTILVSVDTDVNLLEDFTDALTDAEGDACFALMNVLCPL